MAIETIEEKDCEVGTKSPLLMGEGVNFEQRQLDGLPSDGHHFVVPNDTDWEGYDERVSRNKVIPRDIIIEKIESTVAADPGDENIVLHQPELEGEIGTYAIRGNADIIGLIPTKESNCLDIVVFEIKNSDEQKVSHRFQASIYAGLISQLVDSINCEIRSIKTFVLTQGNNLVTDGLSGIEDFEFDYYLAKLRLLLGEGGELDEIFLETPFEDTYNRINSRCAGCDYEALCVSTAAESKGLELLGIDEATQKTLEDIEIADGIQDISDFANLFDQPGVNSRHTTYEALEPTNPDLVDAVRERTDITDLQERSQIAYNFLTELDKDIGEGYQYPHQLQGSGYNLPWDDHNVDHPDYDDKYDPDYPHESLIRVYIYIQHDHALGCLSLLGAVVENSRTEEQIPVTKVIDEITPDDRITRRTEEAKLLKEFFKALGEAISDVAPDLSTEGFEQNEGFPHLYIYSHHQREQLVNALRRHDDVYGSPAVRKLLGLRAGIDQEMVSVFHQEFRERQAFRFAGLGIVQTVAHYSADGGSDWFDWVGEREDGSEIDLTQVFQKGFFDGHVSHDNPSGGFEFDFTRERRLSPEDYTYSEWVYPVQNREVDQIPSEYIWAAKGMMSPDDADDPDFIRQFIYRDDEFTEEITVSDIKAFAKQICLALRHIDEATWSKDRSTPKQALEIEEFHDISFTRRTLAEAIREYQELEFWTNKESKHAYYRRPLVERVAAGDALLIKNNDGEIIPAESPEEYPDAYIEGPLMRTLHEEYDPTIHRSVAPRPLSRSADDWCVAVPVKDESPPEQLHGDSHNPTNIEHGATTILNRIDVESGRARALIMGGWPRGDSLDEKFCVWHYDWTDDESPGKYEIRVADQPVPGEGEIYVIDPAIDDITSSRAAAAIDKDRITENITYTRLNQVYDEEREDLSVEGYPEHLVSRFLTALAYLDERPNSDQRDLIKDTTHSVVLLQGPPGTGKTKYTLAPAVLSRAHAAASTDSGLIGCISAVSHDAVNEAMRSVAELNEDCPPTDDQLELVRICSSDGQEIDHPSVQNVHYHDIDLEELAEWYDLLIDREPGDDQKKIIATTPGTLYRFVDKIAEAGADSDAGELMENRKSRIFDLSIIDEASMIDLPALFLLTAFSNEEGQAILVGDHRQMRPIQSHSWEEEDRVTIERNRPFLSALNFLRFLRGDIDESEFLHASPPSLSDPDGSIPMHQLTETYRLPEIVAQMHTDLYYEDDGIKLVSRADHGDFPDQRGAVDDFLRPVLDPDEPISLLEHFDNTGEKENPIEAALISELIKPFDIVANDTDDPNKITAGVVVPYNRQKRLLQNELDDEIEVDTVEKFQGRERNLIIVSATSGDSNYVNKISEFLLDPNRFNVSTSRMMQKVIIIASDAIFQANSSDTDSFEDQTPWIEFFGKMGGFFPAKSEDIMPVRNVVPNRIFDRLLDESHSTPDPEVKVRRLVGYDSDFEFGDLDY